MHKTAVSTLEHAAMGFLVVGSMLFAPVSAVAAQASSGPTPASGSDEGNGRLERIWLRQQRSVDRLEFMFDHAQQRLDRAQERIDEAEALGKDVSALQAALDAFSAAVKEARPDLESAKGIVQSHKGFDADGKVTDATEAAATVEQLATKLDGIRESLLQPGRDLRDAIREFRRNNRPPLK